MISRRGMVDMDSRMDTLPVRSNAKTPQSLAVARRTMSSPASPEWLDRWSVTDPVPVPAAEIEVSLTSFEDLTAPSTREQLSAVLALAVDYLGAPADFSTKFPIYHALLEDVPADLLAYGMWAALRDECAWFPKVKEIRAPIQRELSRRNDVKRRLETALLLARRNEERRQAS